MKINNIDFGYVWDASGVRGFYGEGYWFHRLAKPFGLNFDNSTFVSKTITLAKHRGFMSYDWNGKKAKQLIPDCVVIKWRKGAVLNAVGMGNPGIQALIDSGHWQKIQKPFFISVAPVNQLPRWRLMEIEQIARIIASNRHNFEAKFGIQLNLSCPNIVVDNGKLIDESSDYLAVLAHFLPEVPIIVKIGVDMSMTKVVKMTEHPACAGICVMNAIAWGQCRDQVNWLELFNDNEESPLKLFGGGALSGAPLRIIIQDWLMKARSAGINKPINAGGGIMSIDDARAVIEAGADSVFIGSVAILRPWRVKSIINAVPQWY